MTFIRVADVHKAFGDNAVLRGMSMSVDLHEVVCLIGASGSGKSTLLRCLNGLEPVDAGTVWVGDIEVTAHDVDLDQARQKVGIVFQQFNLFPHMSVLENITLAPRKVLGQSKDVAESSAGACWNGSGSRTRPMTTRTGCPAVNSSGWRLCGRWR